ncbi:GNAT family N-acetyltransferase [Polluticoccus soli]|uniref:GNAT family N-acetyltransferase n=1 Tax=Polluticoccus soli TaxID=3034150 RepID=UPI0023E18475|nr:GNAT family protein [Flavipsychrobacter sp. JY13-12]
MWLQHPVILENEVVKLLPLESSHFDGLLQAARDPRIWKYLSFNGLDSDAFRNELRSAVLRKTMGEEYPFTVFDNTTGKIIGSTRFYNMYPAHRKLEIGWTWYAPEYWGSGHNVACKSLLLTHAFEALSCVRVQFQVHEQNVRSRAAVERLGAKFEGILRNERIRDNGSIRNTAVYSIINTEWEQVKRLLHDRIKSPKS